jgi:hypothetical protein
VAGGWGFSGLHKTAELYDPAAGAWSVTSGLNTPRVLHTATLLPNGNVLVVGGLASNAPLAFTDSAELYHPATGTWSVTGSLNTPRYSHTATLLPNGKVLIVGGSNDANFTDPTPLNSAELYDPATGTWTITGNLNEARQDHTATLMPNGKVLVAGGWYQVVSAELYDPANGTWNRAGNLNNMFSGGHAATLLPNDKVLIVGGWNGFSPINSAELYEPATEVWSVTASLNTPRSGHTATLLPNGKVLVAGGYSGTGPLSAAELYDPSTGNWSVTASLNTDRSGHTATLLPNGDVLVAGGYTDNGWLSSAELYKSLPPVDAVPPDTSITSGPVGAIGVSSATFSWTGSDNVTPTPNLVYAYRLDPLEASFSAFGSATIKSYSNLANGNYTFYVNAKDQASNQDPTPASRAFIVNVISAWTFCANENEFCSFSGTKLVRYGANTSFNYQTATNGISCNNATFGDPIFGTVKHCDYTDPPPTAWTLCANENQFCSFSGTNLVRYGAGSTFNYQTASNGISCNNATFGDPLFGTVKHCDYTGASAITWNSCADENQFCSFSGTKLVRYGEGTSFTYQTATNGISCNNATFGDPIFGTVKHCDYTDASIQ